jgi:hypothetical protein
MVTVCAVGCYDDILVAMPRKRRRGQTVDATGTVLKAVRLELPAKTHYLLRIEAAKHQMSMASYARHLVETALGKVEKKSERGGQD